MGLNKPQARDSPDVHPKENGQLNSNISIQYNGT